MRCPFSLCESVCIGFKSGISLSQKMREVKRCKM